jgi:hypothetical protein
MNTYFYQDKAGREIGPLDLVALSKFRMAGVLDGDTPVRTADSAEWKPCREVIADTPVATPATLQPKALLAGRQSVWAVIALMAIVGFLIYSSQKDDSRQTHPDIGTTNTTTVIQTERKKTQAQQNLSDPRPMDALGVFGSPYTADYKIVSEYQSVNVEVMVRGPAVRLAVILTNPKGESDHIIVEKDQMISNSHTVKLSIDDPQVGKYVLQVKTVDPEKVVLQKEFTFSLDQLVVEDIKFHLEPVRDFMGGLRGGFTLDGLEIAIRKEGNLPIVITGGSVAVGDAKCVSFIVAGGRIMMMDRKQTIGVSLWIAPTQKMGEEERRHGWGGLPSNYALFWPGDRYLVKGTLVYGEDNKSLVFEKELVVPQAPQPISEPTEPAPPVLRPQISPPGTVKSSGAAPPSVWTGRWRVNNQMDLSFTQDSTSVRGTIKSPDGKTYPISASVDADRLDGSFAVQPDTRRRKQACSLNLRMSTEGNSFSGTMENRATGQRFDWMGQRVSAEPQL